MTDQILRAFTFWIRTSLRDECRAYLESTKLKELAQAPGCRRSAALFRNLGDGTTEVVVVSLWQSIDCIKAAFAEDFQQPGIDSAVRHKLFDREPTVRHYAINDGDALALVPPGWH